MTLVYVDSMVFIYFIERHPAYIERIRSIFHRVEDRGHLLCTSVFTLGEVLTGFYKRDQLDVITNVRDRFGPPAVELLPYTRATANRYARIRSRNRVSPADAIHLATAAEAGVNLFLTNDRRLCNLVIEDINFIAGLDANVY